MDEMTQPHDTRDAFKPGHRDFGAMIGPVASVERKQERTMIEPTWQKQPTVSGLWIVFRSSGPDDYEVWNVHPSDVRTWKEDYADDIHSAFGPIPRAEEAAPP